MLYSNELTRLCAREDYIESCCRESFKTYILSNLSKFFRVSHKDLSWVPSFVIYLLIIFVVHKYPRYLLFADYIKTFCATNSSTDCILLQSEIEFIQGGVLLSWNQTQQNLGSLPLLGKQMLFTTFIRLVYFA
jgi:hypothetical protein